MVNRIDADVSPMKRLYNAFIYILKNTTIKYTFKAEEYETMDTKFAADEYFMALDRTSSYYHYKYTEKELNDVGIIDYYLIKEVKAGNLDILRDMRVELPDGTNAFVTDLLLDNKINYIIDNFEEKNDYYRVLNGYPELNDKDEFFIPYEMEVQLGIDGSIPIHKIQDHYNKIQKDLGNYYISVITTSVYFTELLKDNPDKKYLNYIGPNRIDLRVARKAKNFSILQIKKDKLIRESIQTEFINYYTMCRDYFMKVIYQPDFRSFMERYDNFIAMCIMVMTIEQILVRQIELGVKREFFDIYAIKALYEAYDIPYNLYINEETQQDIVQNLNLLIQNKATNKVFYDIANLLGFPNVDIFKYYLAKQQKYDENGLPIIKKKNKFNVDTGEMEEVYDYEAMYRVYFMKEELRNDDFITTFNDPTNETPYEDIVRDDPYWIEDTDLYNKLWESEYNFVESKYLGVGISYSMTNIVFENVMLLKLIMQKSDELDDIRIQLPRITGDQLIPIYDIIILLICLVADKHNLNGEIITNPAQLIHILDTNPDTDWRNLIGVDIYDDALSIDYNNYWTDGVVKYFLDNPDGSPVDENTAKQAIHKFLHTTEKQDFSNFLVDTFQINFEYLQSSEFSDEIVYMRNILGDEDFEKLISYVSILSFNGDNIDKIEALNQMYSNMKNLYKWLNYKISTTDDRLQYEHFKEIYNVIFYSKEMKELFEIKTETGKRTAFSYFEYLYYRNPGLYSAIFDFDMNTEYFKYLKKTDQIESDFPFENFKRMLDDGSYIFDENQPVFYNLKDMGEADDVSVRDEIIYGYVNHIIARLEMILNDLSFIYLLNDTATPLQQLLEKMVMFFKSFTVDMVKTDILFICDLKPETLLRFFEEIAYMEKWIEPHDSLRIPYIDAIHKITSLLMIKDDCILNDILFYLDYLFVKENKKVRDNIINIDGIEMHEYEYIQSIIDKRLKNIALTEEEENKLNEIVNDRIDRKFMVFAKLSEDKTSAIITMEDGTEFHITPDGPFKPNPDFIYFNMSEQIIFPDADILPYPEFSYDEEYLSRFSNGYRTCEIFVNDEWKYVIYPNSQTCYYELDENNQRIDYKWNGSYYTKIPVYMYRAYVWDKQSQTFVKINDIITNSIRFIDKLVYYKRIQPNDQLDFYDNIPKITSSFMSNDKFKMKDCVAKIWYD